MHATTLLFGALAAFAIGVTAQSNQVPPPPCLKACMDKYPCNTCSDDSSAAIRSCASSTCNFRDVSYADAYYNSVCNTNHGYVSQAGNSSSFVAVPAASCAASTSTAAPSETAAVAEKRAVKFAA